MIAELTAPARLPVVIGAAPKRRWIAGAIAAAAACDTVLPWERPRRDAA
jgi:hypothetical protein